MIPTLITTLINLIFILAYGFVLIFSPAFWFIRPLKLSKLETISISLVLGFALYSLVIYLVRFLHLPFFAAEILLIICQLPALQNFFVEKRFFLGLVKPHLWFIVISLVAALLQAAVLIRSGISTPVGIKFVELSFHDSMQHLAIIQKLWGWEPVAHPGFSGAVLANYHYLIDLTLASVSRFQFLSLFDIYYRLYPIIISVIFQLSVYVFALRLTKNKLMSLGVVIFCLFAGNGSYYWQFFRGGEFQAGANTFMINPLIDLLQNPASIFVLAEMITIIHLIYIYQSNPKILSEPRSVRHKYEVLNHVWDLISSKYLNYLLPFMIISGTMIGFKAWGGMLINITLFACGFYELITKKRLFIFVAAAGSLIISSLLFLPHYQPSTAAGLIWTPGWTLKKMVNDADRWNYLADIFLEEHYIYKHNLPRLILLYSKWTGIYVAGNYFVRLIGLGYIVSWIFKLKKLSSARFAIFVITLMSLILPLLFNQGRMAYDIEQFSPYALLLSSIFCLILLITLLDQSKTKLVLPIGVLLLIGISFPSNITSLKDRAFGTQKLISTDELALFSQVKQLTSPTDTIMLYPSHRNLSTLEFAALTNRSTFYSGRTLSIITGEDYQTRQQELDNFFNRMDLNQQKQYLKNHPSQFLFLYQEDQSRFAPSAGLAEPIFTNSAGGIYRFIPS